MRKLSALSILVIFSMLCAPTIPASAAPWETKVETWVLETAGQGPTEFLLLLDAQADLSPAARLATKAERGQFVYQALKAVADRSQPPVIAALQKMDVDYHPYWIVNAIWVRGDLSVVASLAQRSDVRHVYANPYVSLDAPVNQPEAAVLPEGIEWNITLVGAPEVWALGYTGQGAVVGGADTGYQWDHPALKNQYRGWDGQVASHDYNWFDATADPSPTPIDAIGHGTHTMGTMVGDDGGTNQIGMAPGARWIGCRNMDKNGFGSPETYIACYQWFIAPTLLDGVSEPRPDLAPDVINNSWSCPVSEGCTEPDVLLAAVQNVRAAGILTVHSAGNSGSACSTVNAPGGIYAESFTVGATTNMDVLASFSSRGPVSVDNSFRMKPDISAPGVGIRSSYKDGVYGSLSGTSMAAPHVAGLVALLISADPTLRGQVDTIESTIEQFAMHISSTDCSSSGVPNNLYGWGRIQALEAVQSLFGLELELIASTAVVFPSEVITYTLTVTNTHPISATTNLVVTDALPVGTDFVNASQTFNLAGGVVYWDFPDLGAGQTVTTTLSVKVNETLFTPVINYDYGAVSDEFPLVSGDPVITMLLRRYLLPLTLK